MFVTQSWNLSTSENIRSLPRLCQLLKRKWKIAFFRLNESTVTSTQSEWLIVTRLSTHTLYALMASFVHYHWMQREVAFSRLAFSLSLTDSKSIISSSHLDYCSRIAGNTTNQDVAERCKLKSLNWQIYMQRKWETKWYWNTDEK